MKLIQVNAWLGRLNAPLARFIRAQQPDIVCMQETFAPNPEVIKAFANQYNFVNEIVEAGHFSHKFFTPAWGFTMGGTVINVGNLILSKYPLDNRRSFHTYNHYYVRRQSSDALPNTRVWHACTVQLPKDKTLSIANYQGYLAGANAKGDNTTVQTMQKVRGVLASLARPLIFSGDLNVSTDSPALDTLSDLGLKNLTLAYKVTTTLSSAHRAPDKDRSSVACDYIFVSNEVRVLDFRVSDELVSDHKALILEFDI